MNREIKFRGQEIESKEWVFGDLKRKNDNRFGGRFHYIFVDTDDPSESGEEIRVDASTVGQFTTLKDKKDNEVYESDIVSHCYYGVGVVKWGKQTASYYLDFGTEYEFNMVIIKDCEVNGNIHSNPELLNTINKQTTMNAQEAYEKSTSNLNQNQQLQLSLLYMSIDQAANNGRFSITFSDTIHEVNIKNLKGKGYKLSSAEKCDVTVISWG